MDSDAVVHEAPRFGRRRKPLPDAEEGESAPGSGPAPPSAKTGGWGDGTGSSADADGGPAPPRRRGAATESSVSGVESADGGAGGGGGRGRYIDDGDDDAAVPVIPDLEDAGREDITTKVAQAPRNVTRKVQTLSELNDEARLTMSLGSAGDPSTAGIDLTLLTSVLSAPEATREADEEWDFVRLLQEVGQELQVDREKREQEEGLLGAAPVGGTGAAAAGATGVGVTGAGAGGATMAIGAAATGAGGSTVASTRRRG